jgi:hypothetical protein
MAVFHTRKVTPEQARSFLDIALRHALLQAVAADGRTDIH